MIVGIGFTCILIFALNMTSNYNVLVIALFILLIVLFFLMSFLYGRVYVKVGKDRIYWRKMNGKEVNWDARCYVPIGVGIAIASGGNDNIHLGIISEANIIVATATWRLYKQIFSFDKDMELSLIHI